MRLKKYYANDRAAGYRMGGFSGGEKVAIRKKIIKN